MEQTKVKGLSPGSTKINITAPNVVDCDVFQIQVYVLRPIGLSIVPSSRFAIEGGYVVLNLVLQTDRGEYIPKDSKWDLPKLDSLQLNASQVFVNCSESGDFRIHVESYNTLSCDFVLQVEPKLVVQTVIRLPPNGNCIIEANVNVELEEHPHKRSSIAKIQGNSIDVNDAEGESVVFAKFRHQIHPILVIVSLPSLLHIAVHSPSQIQLLLCDAYSIPCTLR